MMGRRKDEDWTLTAEEAMRLTAYVRRPRTVETMEALHCRAWNHLNGNLTHEPVEDVAGVRKRWEQP